VEEAAEDAYQFEDLLNNQKVIFPTVFRIDILVSKALIPLF